MTFSLVHCIRLGLILATWLFPTLSSAGDQGDDFTNNLFSDLAPVLALFGERFAQQFMSQSLGWLDHIIMAMAPLGILTAMVAAIRIGGPSWLKAVIGRARENKATSELELMSSTSHEVGELWNGQTIIRTLGSPEVMQLIFMEGSKDICHGIFSMEAAELNKHIHRQAYEDPFLAWYNRMKVNYRTIFPRYPWHHRQRPDIEYGELSDTAVSNNGNDGKKSLRTAPNISLNLHGGSKTSDLVFAALCGIVLQFGVLAFAGVTVYHPGFNDRFMKDGKPVMSYAYPLMAIGTAILVVGVMICSAVVERSTEETKWTAQPCQQKLANSTGCSTSPRSCDEPKLNVRIMWLQKSHTVSDQSFDAYVIIAQKPRDIILASQRTKTLSGNQYNTQNDPASPVLTNITQLWRRIASNQFEAFTVLGVGLTFVGFVLQFQAFRGLHWSSSIAQLTAIFIMTVLRAWVRRGLILEPLAYKVIDGYEMDWLALHMVADPDFWTRGNRADDLRDDQSGELIVRNKGSSSSMTSLQNSSRAWQVTTGPRIYAIAGSGRNVGVDRVVGEAQRVMSIRQRLGYLTRWSGPASKPAISVARAVAMVMEKLFIECCEEDGEDDYDEDEYEYEDEDEDDRRIHGDVEERPSISSAPDIRRTYKPSEETTRPATAQSEIIEPKKTVPGQDSTHDAQSSHEEVSTVEDVESFSWYLNVSFNGENHKEIGFTVSRKSGKSWVADATEIESAISLWAFQIQSNEKARLLKNDHSTNQGLIGPNHKDWLQENTILNRQTRRLLGQNEDSLRANLRLWIGAGLDLQTMCADDPDEGLCVGFNGLDSESGGGSILYVVSEARLEQLLAQHIFSAFMWAIAPLVRDNHIQRKETMVKVETDNDVDVFLSLENKDLMDLATSIQRVGLGSLEDTLLCIIPPLSCKNKLPVDAVVDFVHQQTRNQEKSGNWDAVLDRHINLFKFCNTFGLQHVSTLRSAAALVDLNQKINATLNLWRDQMRQKEKIEHLKSLKTKLCECMQAMDPKCLGHLMQVMGASYSQYQLDTELKLVHPKPEEDIFRSHEYLGHPQFFTRFQMLVQILKMKAEEGGGLEDSAIDEYFQRHLQQVNWTDVFSRTALHYAANDGSLTLVRRLLKFKADPHAVDLKEYTPLHGACDKGFEDVVRHLLDAGASVDAQGRDGISPLHLAARAGKFQVVRLLLAKGAKVDIADNAHRNPLHWAAYHGRHGVVELLLKNDASVSARDDYGRTPLLLAILGWPKENNDKTVRKLLEWRVDTNAADYDGRSPLHLVCIAGHEEMCAILLDHGADILIEDNKGKTPIHLAAKHGHERLLAALLVGAYPTLHRTVFHALAIAVQRGNTSVTQHLLEQSFDATDLIAEGYLLHSAAENGHTNVTKCLLEFGAELGLENDDGRTPLEVASECQNYAVVEILVKKLREILPNDSLDTSTKIIFDAIIEQRRFDIVPLFLEATNSDAPEDSILRRALTSNVEIMVDLLTSLVMAYGPTLSQVAQIAVQELHRMEFSIQSFSMIDQAFKFRKSQALTIYEIHQILWHKFETISGVAPYRLLCARILDDEAFWLSTSLDNSEGIAVNENDKDEPYISVVVRGGSTSPVRKIKFIMQSHDQGWGGEQGLVGEYTGSFTWFEAGVSTKHRQVRLNPEKPTSACATKPSEDILTNRQEDTSAFATARHVIQRNVRANDRTREHIVTWHYNNETTSKEVRMWMDEIRPGDTIDVYPKAKYAGWVNYVKYVKVEVFCAWG